MDAMKSAIVYLYLIFVLFGHSSDHSNAGILPNEVGGSKIRGPKLTNGGGGELKKASRPPELKRSCDETVSRSECSQNPKCRWCTSDALDDMCFAKSEALRLPPQVFSCEF